MKTYLPLLFVGIVPVTVSTILYLLNKRVFTKIGYWPKQVLYGIIFGAIAVLGTEFSVQINDVGMNVRDAAPLCAGLFFGWPSAIIAGLIGGIERWFCVYWGGGQLTRVACSIATVFSGCLAALFRSIFFDNKIAKPVYCFLLGILAETMHMLLVIMTNFDNVELAFNVVNLCTVPMVLAVALSVGISSIIIHLLERKFENETEKKIVDISTHFQRSLLVLVTISFLLTNAFCVILQKNLAEDQNEQLLIYALQDAAAEVDESVDAHVILVAEEVAKSVEDLEAIREVTDSDLKRIAETYDVAGILLINDDDYVYCATNSLYLYYHMPDFADSADFAEAFADKNTDSYIQDYFYDANSTAPGRRYAAYRNGNGGYVLVAYDVEEITDSTRDSLRLLAHNTRIGETGSMIIADTVTQEIICDYADTNVGKTLSEIGFSIDTERDVMGTRYEAEINGVDEYYSFYTTDGFLIVAMQTVDEANFAELLSVYLMSFVEIFVFAAIFVIVYFLIKNSVVDKVKLINDDLKKITDGDLNVVVNVRDNMELSTLSDHINTTVDKLKELISEAEKRMENELHYAAEIQRSSLPVNFPNRKETDLYASMDPAKEVGGDFYDFYFLGEDKLCILIADVSGKGVPASLFMMRAKTQIKSYAEYGFEVNDIFTDSNNNLTEGNDAGLFVTSWIGILDLKSGHLTYANAGHNPPLIRMPDGKYEYLKEKPGFVLGGMAGIQYRKFEMDLPEGSSIFIYTDGLTESQNINEELYGEDRLKASIDKYIGLSSKEICEKVKADIRAFQGEADQFDDMTMLHLNFKEKR